MTLGTKLKRRRLELEWTLEEVSKQINISRGYLSEVENDKTQISFNKLYNLTKLYNLSLDSLMTDDDSVEVVSGRLQILIPEELARLAEREGISFKTVLLLLDIAHKIDSYDITKTVTRDWVKFYNTLKVFLV